MNLVAKGGAADVRGFKRVCGVGHWWGGGFGHGGSVPFLVIGGYLGMRPCEKKLKCWLLPMMM